MKNYYQILQIDPKAEIEIIEVAYKRLARKYHPDANNSPNATAQMQEINEAYATLKDEFKRSQYDADLLPKFKTPQNTEPEKNTKKTYEAKESTKRTRTNSSKTNKYYRYKKTKSYAKAKQSVKPDKIVYEEWAKKSKKSSRQSSYDLKYKDSFRQNPLDYSIKGVISKNITVLVVLVIILWVCATFCVN